MNKEQAIEKAKEWNRENPDSDPIKWVAMDEDGEWIAHFRKPKAGCRYWFQDLDAISLGGNVMEHWEDTLTEIGE